MDFLYPYINPTAKCGAIAKCSKYRYDAKPKTHINKCDWKNAAIPETMQKPNKQTHVFALAFFFTWLQCFSAAVFFFHICVFGLLSFLHHFCICSVFCCCSPFVFVGYCRIEISYFSFLHVECCWNVMYEAGYMPRQIYSYTLQG